MDLSWAQVIAMAVSGLVGILVGIAIIIHR